MPGPDKDDAVRFYLIVFQSANWRDPLSDLDSSIIPIIQRKLDDQIKTPSEATEIDLWLESGGGDAHAAYKIFLDLRSRCRRLRVVIPDYAKSAATLLSIGADEIYMAPAAELGPLDAQIEHPDREGVRVSALNVARSLGFVGDFALDFVIRGGQQVLFSTNLPRVDVLRELSRFSALLLRPVMSKLDPHLIHKAADQLEIAHRYAQIMLDKRNLAENDQRELDADGLGHALVNHYPAHEFVISREEAKELGLPVRNAEEYDRWNEIKAFHRAFHEGVFSTDESESIIGVWDNEKLDELLSQDETEESGGSKEAGSKTVERDHANELRTDDARQDHGQ